MLNTKPDYTMYLYYKGPGTNYATKKAAFFGFYEECFENTYKGPAENKEEVFKNYMSDWIYERASDANCFGASDVDKSEAYKEYLKRYLEPDYLVELYE